MTTSLKKIGYKRSDINNLLFFPNNRVVIKLAINPVNHSCAKYIDFQYRKINELISGYVLELDYIPTENMAANKLTKPLIITKHDHYITMLG